MKGVGVPEQIYLHSAANIRNIFETTMKKCKKFEFLHLYEGRWAVCMGVNLITLRAEQRRATGSAAESRKGTDGEQGGSSMRVGILPPQDHYLLKSLIKKRMAPFNGDSSFLIIQRICEASISK